MSPGLTRQSGQDGHKPIEAYPPTPVGPLAYLRDVLSRLPNMTNRQISEVLPAAWAKTQQTKQRAIIGVVA
jgi:hypothetical protein